MDIAAIVSTDRKVEIVHPATGERIGVRIKLVSIDDDRLTKVKRSIADRKIHLQARAKDFKAEELEENRHNLLFAAMLEWEWYSQDATNDTPAIEQPTFNGEVPEFNRRNAIDVFNKLPWFADQVNEAVGETQAFFDNSKRN